MLNKEAILKAEDLPRENVNVPEWKGDVIIRSLTAKERDDYEASLMRVTTIGTKTEFKPNMSNAKAKLVALCLVDAEGNLVFKSLGEGEKVLGGKSAVVINRLFEVAQRLSGLTDADIEELEKNSEAVQADSSPSS